MVKNYFTLYHLASEMKAAFEGGFLFEAFTQDKNELRLSLIAPDKKKYTVVGLVKHPALCLYFNEEFTRRKRNTAALFQDAAEKKIESVRISEFDRLIYFDLADSLQLTFQLFSADTNFFLLKDGIVIQAFKDFTTHEGKKNSEQSRTPLLQTLESLVTDAEKFGAALQTAEGKSLPEKLRRILPGIDTHLSKEILFRASQSSGDIEGNPSADAVKNPSADAVKKICDAASDLFYELISPEPKLCFKNKRALHRALLATSQSPLQHDAVRFSIITETEFSPERIETFDSINGGLQAFATEIYRADSFTHGLEEMKKKLVRLIAKTEKSLDAMQSERAQPRADDYEAAGHRILSHLSELTKGIESIELDDYISGQRVLTKLDPKKSPRENAEAYFEKAKKSRQNFLIAANRLKEFQTALVLFRRLGVELSAIDAFKPFEKWKTENAAALIKYGLLAKEIVEQQTLFKKFRLSEHSELWVGKNAKNNDLLTFKHAKPNELWLHARGTSGSHCVLKTGGITAQPADIEKAAEIAAYYSSARGADLVPVIYTPKKFVRKSKGATVGSVIVEREEVLLVRPRLPQSATDDA